MIPLILSLWNFMGSSKTLATAVNPQSFCRILHSFIIGKGFSFVFCESRIILISCKSFTLLCLFVLDLKWANVPDDYTPSSIPVDKEIKETLTLGGASWSPVFWSFLGWIWSIDLGVHFKSGAAHRLRPPFTRHFGQESSNASPSSSSSSSASSSSNISYPL